MKLWIDISALQGDSDEVLWSGALFGLIYLRKHEHFCSFNVSELSDRQQKLLHNDHFKTESFNRHEADLRVTSANGQLELQQDDTEPQAFANWVDLSTFVCFPQRHAHHQRSTAETDIDVRINLDGTGEQNIDTGIKFLDHMLQQLARHGLIDIYLQCEGDLDVDEHHTIEDVAIALGTAVAEALGDKKGIERYAFALPMDESAATVLLDFSGRPFLKFGGGFNREKVGDFPTEMVHHFFYSLAMNMKATLHISVEGDNDHHQIEACFKSFAHCLRAAVSRSERTLNILPSTKELL